LYLGYASFFVLQKMCPLCLTMYVSVIGIFLVSGAAASVSLTALPARAARDVRSLIRNPAAATIAAIWIVGSVSLIAFFPRTPESSDAGTTEALVAPAAPTETLQGDELVQFEKWLDAQPRVQLPVPNQGAQVLIVKFNDYQCPACRQTYLEYKWIVDKYRSSAPDKVKFVTVDFPLESECGVGSIHGSACEAAAAVRMARAKNRAEQMEEWLFANQPGITPDRVKEGVREVAQVTDFDAQYPKILEQVRADSKLGQQLGIEGTPTFFINGIKINASLRPIYFDAAIAYELKKASGQS
jgi:protein-disulfide isomerase